MSAHESRQIGSGQTRDGKHERQHSKNQQNKWTGTGKFKSDEQYIYYCGQESLRRNGVTIMVNKRVRNAVLGCHLKNDRMIFVRFQGKPFNIQVYVPTSNTKKLKLNGSMKTYKTF